MVDSAKQCALTNIEARIINPSEVTSEMITKITNQVNKAFEMQWKDLFVEKVIRTDEEEIRKICLAGQMVGAWIDGILIGNLKLVTTYDENGMKGVRGTYAARDAKYRSYGILPYLW